MFFITYCYLFSKTKILLGLKQHRLSIIIQDSLIYQKETQTETTKQLWFKVFFVFSLFSLVCFSDINNITLLGTLTFSLCELLCKKTLAALLLGVQDHTVHIAQKESIYHVFSATILWMCPSGVCTFISAWY